MKKCKIKSKDEITPIEVRDKIAKCFSDIHCGKTELESSSNLAKSYCENIVQKAFLVTGGDYSNPDKESLLKALGYLSRFSESFFSKKEMEDNHNKMSSLIEKIK